MVQSIQHSQDRRALLSGKSAYRFESKFTSDLQHGYKHNDRNLVDSGSAACMLETIFSYWSKLTMNFCVGLKFLQIFKSPAYVSKHFPWNKQRFIYSLYSYKAFAIRPRSMALWGKQKLRAFSQKIRRLQSNWQILKRATKNTRWEITSTCYAGSVRRYVKATTTLVPQTIITYIFQLQTLNYRNY